VPLLARIFVVIAPLYWINPFDLIPDLQPNGHLDDITLVILLVVMALRLVPKEVFRDARNAVNPAVCTVMCLGLVGITAAGAAGMKAPAKGVVFSQPIFSSVKKINVTAIEALGRICSTNTGAKADSKRNPQKNLELQAKLQSPNHPSKCFASSHASTANPTNNHLHDKVDFVHKLLETDSLDLHNPLPDDANDSHRNKSLPSFLTNRGGQNQLYCAEDAGAFLPLYRRPLQMPQQLTLGFFVAERPSCGGAGCC